MILKLLVLDNDMVCSSEGTRSSIKYREGGMGCGNDIMIFGALHFFVR